MVSLAMRMAPAASRRLTTSASSSKVWCFEAGRAPGCGVALDGEEVFGSPGDAVQGAAVLSAAIS